MALHTQSTTWLHLSPYLSFYCEIHHSDTPSFSCTWHCSTFLLICVQHVLEYCFHLYSLIYYPFIIVFYYWVPLGFLTEIWSLAIRLGWLAGEPLGFACLHLLLPELQVCATTSGLIASSGCSWRIYRLYGTDGKKKAFNKLCIYP